MHEDGPRRVAAAYLLRAGLIDVPPKMYEAAQRWIESRLAAHLQHQMLEVTKLDASGRLVGEVGNDILPRNVDFLRGLNTLRLPIAEIKSSSRIRLKTDLSGWRYAGRVDIRRLELLLPYIMVELRRRVDGGAGFWDTAKHLLAVEIPQMGVSVWEARFPEIVTHKLAETARVLRHEMTHASQTLLGLGTQGKDPGSSADDEFTSRPGPGMPSRHRMTPQFVQTLQKLAPSKRKMLQERLDEIEKSGLQPHLHELDDVEFYTRLSDEVDKFQRAWTGVSGKDREAAFRYWVSAREPKKGLLRLSIPQFAGREGHESPWFRVLRQHAPGKWQKAVKELMKLVV